MAQPFNADRLLAHLQAAGDQLAPLYTISGDEPLMVMEMVDAIRAAARVAGYTHRSAMVMDARSDWVGLSASLQNVSLFGERRVVELKIPTGKPGKAGADVLTGLAERSQSGGNADMMMVISLPRLDKTTRLSRWATALAQGIMVDLPPIARSHLPTWIGERLAQQKQSAATATLDWIADKVEGNLLAAHQEIQKLGLLYPEGQLTPAAVEAAVLNVARYDVFGLRDAMLAGEVKRTVHILDGLKAEGEALPLVLWTIGEEIRLFARLLEAQSTGQSPATLTQLMHRWRIFGAHERLVLQAWARVPRHVWPAAVQHAHEVDRLIKGLPCPGRLLDPWQEMTRLALRVAAAGPEPR